MSTETKSTHEWMRTLHPNITILDPDGWRHDGLSMDEPITQEDFGMRLALSTIMGFPLS